MATRVRVKIGPTEIEVEGSEDFVRDQVPTIIDKLDEIGGAEPLTWKGRSARADDSEGETTHTESPGITSAIEGLSAEIGVEPRSVTAACAPSETAPYLQLDRHFYAAFKENTPSRGANAIPDSVLLATLMSFWFEHAELDGPSHEQLLATIRGSNLSTSNARRGVENCEWLQYRQNQIVITPTDVNKAVAVAKAYCTKEPVNN